MTGVQTCALPIYFQPILDRLQVVPTRFDLQKASIVLEGKSDYYVLRYAIMVTKRTDMPLFPGMGAGTFGALAAMHVGWNLNFLFVLDGDKQGKTERDRYISEFGIPSNRIVTIDQFIQNVRVIEDLLDGDALVAIQRELGLSDLPTKGQIKRFCQERLASGKFHDLSPQFILNANAILDGLNAALAQ